MALSPPKSATWWIALILGALGVLMSVGEVSIRISRLPFPAKMDLWLVLAGLVLMLIATRFSKI
jgi:uncharacterized membrane protein YsdA (DUF1294 family)